MPLLLYRRGTTWSLPALAPLLGLAGLAGAFPALAGRARGPLTRAALGALGAWWALLAAPLLGRETLGARAPARLRGAGDPPRAPAIPPPTTRRRPDAAPTRARSTTSWAR